MRQFIGEIFDPVKDFYKIRKPTEKLICILIPFLIGLVCAIMAFVLRRPLDFNHKEFVNDILNQLITILTLFVSFSMAYLSIIVASSSQNITDLKDTFSKEYFLSKEEPCTLYQVLVSEISYTLVTEIFFLIFALFQKFIFVICGWSSIRILISIDIALFSHVLLVMLVLIKNIYYSFWQSE